MLARAERRLSIQPAVGRDDWLAAGAFDRVEIEIGPGNCGFLFAAAACHPRTLHVGIEVHDSSVTRVQQTRPMPANVRLLSGDGGWLVRHLLAPSSIDAFHVYFPDPWWKKRHQKRRLFQPDVCAALARVLVPGGCVFVVTDVVVLFEEIVERMLGAGFVREDYERDAAGSSAYEQKYRRQGRRFEQAVFRKRS